jgi:hypothetical protein
MQFTLEQEENAVNFLDLTISRTDNFQFSTYCKPTTTTAIVPSDSCHPSEHKLNVIRYLHNRNATYLTTLEDKQNETTIIKHVVQANKYGTSLDTKHQTTEPEGQPRPNK